MGTADKSGFDWQMHYFRAFAILMIMATHYCGVFGFDGPDRFFFRSSTIFFLFISGYLCQHIFNRRPQTPQVYGMKKLANVISPFLVFSIAIGLMRGDSPASAGFWRDVLMGRMQLQYWYIPFVSLLFLVSPALCRLKDSVLMPLAAVSLVLLSTFPVRPQPVFALAWPHAFHLYVYFTFFYLLGFVYCRRKVQIFEVLKRNSVLLAILAVLVSAVMPFAPALGLETAGLDALHAVHKTLLGAVVLVVLDRVKDRKVWILDQLAKCSFTLYFIHLGIFLQTVKLHDSAVSLIRIPLFAEFVVFCAYVLAMLLAATLAKTVLGKWSRPIIAA